MAYPERMWFQKTRGNNHHNILAKMESYDFSKQPNEQGEKVEAQELTDNFYEYVTEYYIQNPELNVTCYQKVGVADSDSEEG